MVKQALTVAKPEGSLHDRLWFEITNKILTGVWAPGDRIPFEHELTTEYGCSRATINKVMTRLAGAGLIERRRKAGSFVMRPHTQSAVLRIQDIGAEVSALGHTYDYRLITRIERLFGSLDVGKMDLQRRSPILELTCSHFAGKQPFCTESRLVNLHTVPEARDQDFSVTPPGTWLRKKIPWTSAEHTIGAIGADEQIADILKIEPRSPCLVVKRRTWINEQPVTFVVLTYPADAHQLVARFEPSNENR